MWMVNPRILCRKHLLGEHVELHMFVGTLNKGLSIEGYLKNNLLEIKSLFKRHQVLAKEMLKRGYNHKSPLVEKTWSQYPKNYLDIVVDREKALKNLLNRCSFCLANYEKEKNYDT